MGWLNKIGSFLGNALPAVGTIVGSAFGGPVGGALGGALGSVGSGLLGDSDAATNGLNSAAGQNQALSQLQMEQNFNSAEAQKNRDFQLEMWNADNEYNSPVAQLERLKQAGINPNAMFGSSGYSPVASSAPAGAQAASSASIASSLLLQDAQLANLIANTRNTNRDADIKEQEYAYNNVTFNERVKSLKYANNESKARLDKIVADTDLQKQAFEFLARKNEQELNNLRELGNKYRAEIKHIDKQNDVSDAQIEYLDAQTKGQQNSNSLSKLELDFSKESGVPHGTPIEEVIWKTIVNGEFDSLIDIFIETVENYALTYLEKRARGLVGDDAVDFFKGLYDKFGRVRDGVSPHKNGRSETSLPYAKTNYNAETIYNP